MQGIVQLGLLDQTPVDYLAEDAPEISWVRYLTRHPS